MDLDLAALPADVDALHRLIRQLAAERTGERKALSAAQAKIERLRLIVQNLQRLQFGRRAERLDGDQLELGLEDLGAHIARPGRQWGCKPFDVLARPRRAHSRRSSRRVPRRSPDACAPPSRSACVLHAAIPSRRAIPMLTRTDFLALTLHGHTNI